MSPVSRGIDRIGVTFDEPSLVADAGLIVPATLMVRLGLDGDARTWSSVGSECVSAVADPDTFLSSCRYEPLE